MSPHSRIRRLGWFAALGACTALYLTLHLKVHAVLSEVVRAERQIVALEHAKLLLETEFETRSNQLQLAAWNRVDFGYTAPTAAQFLENERQLASLGSPRAPGSPEPIRVAGAGGGDEPDFPQLLSPLTGKPLDRALIAPDRGGAKLARAGLAEGAMRIPLRAMAAGTAE